ncbi:MAG TPA: hypothetical protein VM661_09340 [Candidatus Sulfotelmatobacter sp.]|nr:hypothetical protein [Candidatus Sulfotelmatobacter sp.]
MRASQSGSALIIGTMALLAVGLAAVALLRLEGQSWQLDHNRQAGLQAQRIRTAVELYAVRHGAVPAPGPVPWRDLGLAPQDVTGFSLDGGCAGWSLAFGGQSWRFPSPDGCQAPKAGG